MLTYQDLLAKGKDDTQRIKFVQQCIEEHRNSQEYRIAETAQKYYDHENPDIAAVQKVIYDMQGIAHKDAFSANHKIPSNYYFFFVSQAVLYLLGNGAAFNNQDVKKRLGANFDRQLVKLLTDASNSGVSWGFFDNGKVEYFPFLEFKPLYDEMDGACKAGVRFWQIDDTKPLRAVLYELDGFTELTQSVGDKMQITAAKRPYKLIKKVSAVDEQIFDYQNYPAFPIVPLYYLNKKSALVGNRQAINAFDLMISKLINNVSEADLIYWVLTNCNGMDEIDDANFIVNMIKSHVVHVDGDAGASAVPHNIEAPFQASQAALAELRALLFDSFMAFDVKNVSAGNPTATEIRAAYQMLDSKCDMLEYNVIDFIQAMLVLAGEDETEPFHFTRSKVVNVSEEVTNVLQSAPYLGDEATTKKLCELLGMIDDYDAIQAAKAAEIMAGFGAGAQSEE